jgi:hypothetical protein
VWGRNVTIISGKQSAGVETVTGIKIIGGLTTIRGFTFVSSLAKRDIQLYVSSA